MDDRVLRKFFSSGRDLNENISSTPNLKTSLLNLTPQYHGNKYYTSHNLNMGIDNRFISDQIHLPDYRYTPPNLPNQKYLPEQVKINENQFNSFNRNDIEIGPNRLAVYNFIT